MTINAACISLDGPLLELSELEMMTSLAPKSEGPVAVIGAGSIGVAWAVTFGRAGWRVVLQDPDSTRLEVAMHEVASRVEQLASFDLLDKPTAEVIALVTHASDLGVAASSAQYVQECAPEDLEIKRRLFRELDEIVPTNVVLASSSSMLPCSRFASDLAGRARVLVAHPGNPPYLLPVVELVPAPFTSPDKVVQATAVLESIGMAVVNVRKEIEGFVFNRLQGALLREAYCLVRDGVIDVEDLDRVVRDGLGRRWAIVGPFETVDLNTRGGIEAHASRMGAAYERMGATRGEHDPWTPELVRRVTEERRRMLPLELWEERVAWRDRMLMALEHSRRAMAKPKSADWRRIDLSSNEP